MSRIVANTDIQAIFPLSPLQHGLLFHALLEPGPQYFQQWQLSIEGKLDASALKEAWRLMVARHDALRTSFFWKRAGEPLQIVRREVPLPWEEHDWSGADPEECPRRWTALLQRDRERGFDLSRAPLARLTLVRLGTESRLLWSNHHTILDAWSRLRVFGELLRVFDSLRKGQVLRLEPTRPYSDYIAWLRGQSRAQAEEFWRRTMGGFASPTHIPSMPSSEIPADGDDSVVTRRRLDAGATANLRSFARRERLTVNTLVQGAWSLLLSRYADEKDVVFGATVSGRPPQLAGVDSMVGLFINTLPVRVQVDSEMPVSAWLSRIQREQLAAREFEWTALTDIQGWSRVPRGTQLFESLLVSESVSMEWERACPLDLKIREIGFFERTNYPLTVVVDVAGDELLFEITHDRRRFGDDSIDRMLGHLQTCLLDMTLSRERPIGSVSMLSEAERRRLLYEWNQTEREYPRDKTVQVLFEEQAEKTPNADAVVAGDRRLTYAELNARANRLAWYLSKRGVGPEILVGLCVERSVEMVVGLLGVLKAGGAYVPFDPSYPPQRLAFMREDAAAPLVLTQAALEEVIPDGAFELVRLDADWPTIARESSENPPRRATAENLAYVIYTSGSTGRPKGAMILHRGVVNYLTWCVQAYSVASGRGAPVQSSLSFDLTVTSLLGPLVCGRTSNLLPAKPAGTALAELFAESEGWSLVKATPAEIELLSRQIRPEHARGRTRALVIGGENLAAETLGFWRAHACGTKIFNEYGPTETVVGCCIYEVGEGLVRGSVPIGRPIANTQIYVLDRNMQPAPIGVPGELWIGGAGVARGYLNRPELTAQAFRPNPFSTDPTARIYRSGDLARFRADGNLEFLGRQDDQIKVRGFRIEPGEIETVLAQHPSVAEGVMIAREDSPGDRRLVAYVVAGDHGAAPTADLRAFLKDKLPEYMLPSAFVFLEALPLTSNGKIDRRALPPPEQTRPELENEFLAPRDSVEQMVAEIWSQVLGLQQIGIHDNFFELGGHSLLATQVISRLRDGFSGELRALFQFPTVAGFAGSLSNKDVSSAAAPIAPLDRERRRVKISDAGLDAS